jgi:hypothetical protein
MTTDVTTNRAGEGEPDAAVEGAVLTIGPLRNPDDCVLACPDCSCRRLLEERRGGACERENSTVETDSA